MARLERFTEGPWEYDPSIPHLIRAPKSGWITRDICRLDGSTMAAFNQRANGFLITASPTMYRMLQDILNSDMAMRAQDEGRTCPELERTRLIMAKARGE